MNEEFSRGLWKELREAEREMERNKRSIENSGRAGTPSYKATTWSRKRKKNRGPSS